MGGIDLTRQWSAGNDPAVSQRISLFMSIAVSLTIYTYTYIYICIYIFSYTFPVRRMGGLTRNSVDWGQWDADKEPAVSQQKRI